MARPRKPAPAAPDASVDEDEKTSQTQDTQTSFLNLFKSVITLVSSFTILLLVFLWYVGRKYNTGFFLFLKIPISELSFSNWDYGEVSWTYIPKIATIFIITIIVSVFNILFIEYVVSGFENKFKNKASIILPLIINGLVIWLLKTTLISPGYTILAAICYIFVTIFLYIFRDESRITGIVLSSVFCCIMITVLILGIGLSASIEGIGKARMFYTENTQSVRILTSKPLIHNYPSQVISNTIPLYLYENLNLIIVNNDKYFLATGLTEQCKPEKVFVLKAEDVASVEYTTKAPLKPGCIPIELGAATIPISSTPTLTITVPTITP